MSEGEHHPILNDERVVDFALVGRGPGVRLAPIRIQSDVKQAAVS